MNTRGDSAFLSKEIPCLLWELGSIFGICRPRIPSRRSFARLLALVLCFGAFPSVTAPLPASDTAGKAPLSDSERESFLSAARIARMRNLSEGITNSRVATLANDAFTHDAHIQTIDEFKPSYTTLQGTEINFRDSYKFNLAAYKLDRLLGIGMVPVTVERKVGGSAASVTWWADDVMMTEKERYTKKVAPPDESLRARQIHCVRVFDELIYNTDRNLGNLVICKGWRIWMIDHTRAFRSHKELKNPKNLEKCDRQLLAALRRLDKQSVTEQLSQYLDRFQIDGLLARRDKIVEHFEKAIARNGESAIIYDYLPAKW
jgi:hypothetical protein